MNNRLKELTSAAAARYNEYKKQKAKKQFKKFIESLMKFSQQLTQFKEEFFTSMTAYDKQVASLINLLEKLNKGAKKLVAKKIIKDELLLSLTAWQIKFPDLINKKINLSKFAYIQEATPVIFSFVNVCNEIIQNYNETFDEQMSFVAIDTIEESKSIEPISNSFVVIQETISTATSNLANLGITKISIDDKNKTMTIPNEVNNTEELPELPEEVLNHIFTFLKERELRISRAACKDFKRIITDKMIEEASDRPMNVCDSITLTASYAGMIIGCKGLFYSNSKFKRYEERTGKRVYALGLEDILEENIDNFTAVIAIHPITDDIIIGSYMDGVSIYDSQTGQWKHQLANIKEVTALVIHPISGDIIIGSSASGGSGIYDSQTGQCKNQLIYNGNPPDLTPRQIIALVIHPITNDIIVVSNEYGYSGIYDSQTGHCKHRLIYNGNYSYLKTNKITAMAIHPITGDIIIASNDCGSGIYNSQTGHCKHLLVYNGNYPNLNVSKITAIVIHPISGDIIIASNDFGASGVYDSLTGKMKHQFTYYGLYGNANIDKITAIVIHPITNDIFIAANAFGPSGIYDSQTGKMKHQLNIKNIRASLMLPSGHLLVATNKSLKIVDLESGKSYKLQRSFSNIIELKALRNGCVISISMNGQVTIHRDEYLKELVLQPAVKNNKKFG